MLAGLPGAVRANDPPNDRRPEAARRTVARFDFEEYATNPEPVPIGWRVEQDRPGHDRPGFPIFNAPTLDYEVAHEGRGSVRLPTRGGSTALALEVGVVPIFPGADYRVSAMVRTLALRHARAFVEACLIDARGAPIEQSRRRSAPIRTEGAWAEADVVLWGEWPDAAFLRIELLVLQPAEFESEPPGYSRVWPADVSGDAWFDDVRVVQQPRLSISTGAPGGIVLGSDRVGLDLVARDLSGEALWAECRVYDLHGRIVASSQRSIRDGRWIERWEPDLDRHGWYRAVVEVWSGAARVGRQTVTFAWLPPEAPRPDLPDDGAGLGVAFTHARAIAGTEQAQALRLLGAEHASIPVWDDALSPGTVESHAARLAAWLAPLRHIRSRVAFSMPRVPRGLADGLGIRTDQVLRAVASTDPLAHEYLDPLMDRFGQAIVRWQVGQVGDESALSGDALASEVAVVAAALARLVPGPRIILPWRADREMPGHGLESARAVEFQVLIPREVWPEAIEGLVRSWSEATGPDEASESGPRATFVIEAIDADRHGAAAAVADLVRRTVFAWRGSGPRDPSLALVDPWEGGEHGRSPLMPRPEAVAWNILRERLRGRMVVGEMPSSGGVRCFILAPRDGRGPGALVAWSEWADPADAYVEGMLAIGPVRVIDAMGNGRTVAPAVDARGGMAVRLHRVEVSQSPVFVEGVDVALALLQASFRIEPGLIAATATTRDIELVLANPWPTPIAGRAFIVEPGGASADGTRDRSWRIEPRSIDFEAPPGQVARLPISLLLREFERAGTKRWVVDLRLTGREDLGWITVAAPLEVGVEGLDVRIAARTDGPDLEVEVTIANLRDAPIEVDATVFAPGQPRERRSIGQIGARSRIIRRVAYPGLAHELSGQEITVSVRVQGTGARVNVATLAP